MPDGDDFVGAIDLLASLRRVDHADDEAIWDALREFQAGHAALRGTSVVYNPDVERRYHRRALTERLAAWLNGL